MPSDAARRLHPVSILFLLLASVRAFVGPAIVAVVLSPGRAQVWLGLLALPAGLGAIVRYWFYRYRLADDGLVVVQGLLNRSERHVPYARIQNVNVKQTLLHRGFGVAEVQLETAGGDEPEATMRVLGMDEVDAIRERVASARARRHASTADEPDGAVRPAAAREVLLRMSTREVALFGALSNRGMVIVAAALGLLWQLDLPWFDPQDGELWRGAAARLESLPIPGPVASAVGLAALLAVVLAAMRALSVVWAVLRFHGFVLTRQGDDLRTERGLLTRVAATVPRRRIQLVSVHEGVLHRLAGRVGVRVETAGGTAKGDREGGGENLWMAPLVRREDAPRLLRELVPELEPDRLDWQPISPRAGRRLLRRNLLLALLATAGLAAATRSPWAAAALVALVPWAVAAARLRVRHTAWALADEVAVYRSGWWTRRTSAVTYAKVQAIGTVATPFDRRHGMARVQLDTAGAGRVGHRVAVPLLDAAVARSVHDRVEREASARTFRW